VVGNAQEDQSPTNIESGVLFPYTHSMRLYRCPADKSAFNGAARLPRHRSYMLSIYLHGPVNGTPDGAEYDSRVRIKSTQISHPDTVFALLDGSVRTINDDVFNLGYVDIPANWYDDPADRHGQGCNFSFVDGHISHLKWQWPKAARTYSTLVANEHDLQDLHKLQMFIPEP
jgi:prepilin-type processing-associated H-X9-DG protein